MNTVPQYYSNNVCYSIPQDYRNTALQYTLRCALRAASSLSLLVPGCRMNVHSVCSDCKAQPIRVDRETGTRPELFIHFPCCTFLGLLSQESINYQAYWWTNLRPNQGNTRLWLREHVQKTDKYYTLDTKFQFKITHTTDERLIRLRRLVLAYLERRVDADLAHYIDQHVALAHPAVHPASLQNVYLIILMHTLILIWSN